MQQNPAVPVPAEREAVFQSFLSKVFAWMFVGLGVSGVIAFWFRDNMAERIAQGNLSPWIMWGLPIAQIVAVLALSFGIRRISASTATILYIGYAALTGLTFAWIFALYELSTIWAAFIASAGMFGAMALIGYTTKKDLTKFGMILIMALIGSLIAGLVTMFFAPGISNFIWIWGMLVIFLGLTVYDVWRMKRQFVSGQDDELVRKATIIGALSLYLDFINIFIRMLAILGNR